MNTKILLVAIAIVAAFSIAVSTQALAQNMTSTGDNMTGAAGGNMTSMGDNMTMPLEGNTTVGG
jgi:hypothetical protein